MTRLGVPAATSILVSLAIALPWLLPPQAGPSPPVIPWLLAIACTGVLAGALPLRARPIDWSILIGPGLAFIVCVSSNNMETYAATMAIMLVTTCAMTGLRSSTHEGLVSALPLAWLIAALVSCTIGLLQYFGFEKSFSPWMSPSVAGEAYGNLRQRNLFASLTNIGIASLLWGTTNPKGKVSPPPPGGPSFRIPFSGYAWAVASALLLAFGNAASSSRTGLVQLIVIGIFTVWWSQGKRGRESLQLLLVASLGYVVAALSLPLLAGLDPSSFGIISRLNERGTSCASRLTLWSNVLHLIAQKPWLGWGWGELDFAHFITLYPGARFCDILDNAHNLPLHLAVELGIPAALLICGSGLWVVWRARPWQERDATRQMAWGVLAVILLHSMLEYPLWYGPFQMAFGMCILLLSTTPARYGIFPAEDAPAPSTRAPFSPFTLITSRFIAIFIIASAAYAAWDYHRISQIYLAPAQRDEAYRSNTLAKIKASWLFQNQVRFAELTTTALNADNAAYLNAMALELLHFSPEALVVEKLIDSAAVLDRQEEVEFFKRRYQAAFPDQYEKWARKHEQP